MGNQSPQPQANFRPETSFVDQMRSSGPFGNHKTVVEIKTGTPMILREIYSRKKQYFQSEQNFLNTSLTISHPNKHNLIGYNTQTSYELCSPFYKICIFLEYFNRTLQTEIEIRRNTKSDFSEDELLLLADDMITVLAFFQEHSIPHGDICPINIFQINQIYKLSDPFLFALKWNRLLGKRLQKPKSYLAPELVVQISNGDLEIKTDKYKADVYSLGMTLLSVATLMDCDDLYNYQEGTVDQSLIRERLDMVRLKYNEFIHDLIKDMLVHNIEERPDSRAVAAKFAPYKDYMRKGDRELDGRVNRVDCSFEELDAKFTTAVNKTKDTLRTANVRIIEKSKHEIINRERITFISGFKNQFFGTPF